MNWQDMEDAPLDGTIVDLYVREEINGHLFREPNCFFDSTQNDWFLMNGVRWFKELGWVAVRWQGLPKPPEGVT